MTRILLGVIGNGRKELLDQTLKGLTRWLVCGYELIKVAIDDTGDAEYQASVRDDILPIDWNFFPHAKNRGLSGSIQTLWMLANKWEADYILHFEEDFLLGDWLNVDELLGYLTKYPYLGQIALKRQHVNSDEVAAGGFMHQYEDDYVEYDDRVETTKLFTFNPCLYEVDKITKYPYPDQGGERELTDRLLHFYPDMKFGYVGKKDDPPRVWHTGSYRAPGWKL